MTAQFATKEDVPSWLELLTIVKDNFPGLIIEEYIKYLAESIDHQCALVVKDDDTVIGALTFSNGNKGLSFPAKSPTEIEFLAVHPKYRKSRIATTLINCMFAQFPKGTNFSVVTYRENDTQGKAARNFYSSIGFTAGELITIFDYPCQELHYITK